MSNEQACPTRTHRESETPGYDQQSLRDLCRPLHALRAGLTNDRFAARFDRCDNLAMFCDN